MTGDLRATTWVQVLTAALAGVAVAWFVESLFLVLQRPQPPLAWSVAVVLALAALAAGAYAWWFRGRLRAQTVPHEQAIRSLIIAKATIRVGALAAGGYLLLFAVNLMSSAAPLPRQRAIVAGVTAVIAIVVAIVGWALERVCRIPDDDDKIGREQE